MRTLRARNRDRLRDWTVFVRAVVAAPAAFERVPAEGRGVVVIIIIRVVVVVSRSCSSCSSSVRLGVSRDAAVASVVDPPVALGGRGGPVVSHVFGLFFERSHKERTNERIFFSSFLFKDSFLVLGFRVTQERIGKEKKKLLEKNSGLLKRRRRIFVCILLQKTFEEEEEEEEERACVNDGGRGHRHERKRRTSSVGVGALHHHNKRRRRRRL